MAAAAMALRMVWRHATRAATTEAAVAIVFSVVELAIMLASASWWALTVALARIETGDFTI